MCPIGPMLGAPCWPLKCCTSAANESWPPSPKEPRVLACVEVRPTNRTDSPTRRESDLQLWGEVDQARSLQRAQKLPRVIVGKRRRELSQAKCGEGAHEYRAGGNGAWRNLGSDTVFPPLGFTGRAGM